MKVQLGNWEVLTKIFPKKCLNQEVVAWLDTYTGPLSIACSGGPDSLILLLLTRLYWPQNRCFLLYYNHKIRPQADDEETYLKSLADILKISFIAGHRKDFISSTEADLREARYHFFEKILKLHNSQALLLGQHEDDCVETVLLRLFRGSSLDGIIAPRAVHPLKTYTKLRPLLSLTKTELQIACEHCGIHYFVDYTNFEDICIRNRLRKYILPQLEKVFEGTNWRKGFKRTCTNLIEQNKFLTYCEKKYLEDFDLTRKVLDRNIFLRKSIWEQNLQFREWIRVQCGIGLSFDRLEAICNVLNYSESATVTLDKTYSLVLQKNTIGIKKIERQKTAIFSFKWKNGIIFFPQNTQLSMQYVPACAELYAKIISGVYKDTEVVALDGDITKAIYVRNWKHGDRYQPIGFSHEKKVKHLFSERKIELKLKKQLPIITDAAGKILWIPGLPPAEYAKVKPNTKLFVFLIYKKNKLFIL